MGIAFEVPVAFLSGFSRVVSIPALTGSESETNTTGMSLFIFTIACVVGVAIVATRSTPSETIS
ncbi:hypothetical protein SDC9_173513 [bioreactor metagenome]|uniref:Uncharacterized protein n=1 Tax=bioreactor metagenome TaxID=1076179 RepID=A0A645GJS8_9ZZZZ